MIRKKLLTTVLPSMLAGGLLFGSAVTSADDGRTLVGFWPAAGDVGGVQLAQRPPIPPTPTKPPKPPKAPKAGGGSISVQHDGGFSVTVKDGKVQVSGIEHMVDEQINSAIDSIQNDSNIPLPLKTKIISRLEKSRVKAKSRVAKIDVDDLDDLGEELGKMGEELGKEMEELGKEMEKLGKDLDKDLQNDLKLKALKKLGKFNVHVGRDDDDDDDDHDDWDFSSKSFDFDDDDDIDDAVRDLGDLKLRSDQRDTIKKLRQDSDNAVANAKRELARAEETLEKKLSNAGSSEGEIANAIDAVTRQEAAIRKARILAWVKARNILDESQRKKVESTKGKTK